MSSLQIELHRDFEKQFSKLTKKSRERALQALDFFDKEPDHPSLRNHALVAEWKNHRSISAGGNLRLHFRVAGDVALFVAIGTHSQLYS